MLARDNGSICGQKLNHLFEIVGYYSTIDLFPVLESKLVITTVSYEKPPNGAQGRFNYTNQFTGRSLEVM